MRDYVKQYLVAPGWLPALACAALVAVAGCAAIANSNALQVASHLAVLERSYAEAQAIYWAHIDNVPEERRAEIQRAWGLIDALAARLNVDDVTDLLARPAEARALYGMAQSAWSVLRAEAVWQIEAGAIDPLQAARLAEIDRRAVALDAAMARLEADPVGGHAHILDVVRDLAPLAALLVRAVL